MGFKAKAVLINCFLFCLISVADVGATSLNEFYEFYNVDYTEAYPNNTINIIRNYQDAQRYVKCYRGVIESEFDSNIYNAKLKQYEKELEETEKLLLNCYNASLYEICILEDKYVELQNNIDKIKLSMVSSNSDIEIIDSSKIPSYEEYTKAIEEKARIDTSDIIGDIDKLEPPIASSKLVDSHSKTSTTYLTTQNAPIKALFSGKVSELTKDSCVITNDYKISVYYRNLSNIDVEIGQDVQAGELIGNSYTYITLQLKLNNTFVDLTKLFEKE